MLSIGMRAHALAARRSSPWEHERTAQARIVLASWVGAKDGSTTFWQRDGTSNQFTGFSWLFYHSSLSLSVLFGLLALRLPSPVCGRKPLPMAVEKHQHFVPTCQYQRALCCDLVSERLRVYSCRHSCTRSPCVLFPPVWLHVAPRPCFRGVFDAIASSWCVLVVQFLGNPEDGRGSDFHVFFLCLRPNFNVCGWVLVSLCLVSWTWGHTFRALRNWVNVLWHVPDLTRAWQSSKGHWVELS